MKKVKILVACLILSSPFFSCKKDPDKVAIPINPNEGELITTVTLTFIEKENPLNKVIAAFRDPDGDGPKGITQWDTIRLDANKTYDVEALLLDETKTPLDTISNEVKEEGDGHQLFYIASNPSLTITYADKDENGVPIGLKTVFKTGNAATGKDEVVKVLLKHQGKDKPKSGSGDINVGDTDINVTFPVIIK
ncbi:MAG TPA: hypothetical protein VF691_07695 [Cytophagaceae bacterium]|jgi:hypothetical protein